MIALQAARPAEAPVAVFQAYNRSPFVIAFRTESPIKAPNDLEGRTIGGPILDGALKLFPTFAKIAKIVTSQGHRYQHGAESAAKMLMRGQIDGAFAFYTGISWTKLLGAGLESELRFIRYEDYGMDLYSNTIMSFQGADRTASRGGQRFHPRSEPRHQGCAGRPCDRYRGRVEA